MDDQSAVAGAKAFEQLVGLLDYPMFVVTVNRGELAGCLVGFATQVSIRPPRFLVGLSKRNHTFRVAERADRLAVHVLPREQRELARLFGSETGDRIDKFDRCAWRTGPDGIPILVDAVAWFVGDILSRIDVGDHVGFLLEPTDGSAPRRRFDQPVTFADVRDLDPGHEA